MVLAREFADGVVEKSGSSWINLSSERSTAGGRGADVDFSESGNRLNAFRQDPSRRRSRSRKRGIFLVP
jgi:hypothetical protein